MAAALLCFPGLNEIRHAFEDFVSSSEIFVNEVAIVQLEKPVV